MTLPLLLNSRTFVRNFQPRNLPTGLRAGYDWNQEGGTYDNTDPRNVVYWGPPRIVPGDLKYDLEPGEDQTEGIRRLKVAGYIGLYSARAEQERKRQEARDEQEPVNSLQAVAAAVAFSQSRAPLSLNRVAEAEGRRPSRLERRTMERRIQYAATISGEELPVPSLTSADEEDTAPPDTPDPYLPTEDPDPEEFADDVPEAEPETVPDPAPAFVAPPGPPAPSPVFVSAPHPTPPLPEEDAPVGGGGNAATGRPNYAPTDTDPITEPAPNPPARGSGSGLAGGGSRRKNK